ncbi:transposase family protein [Streptomyces sp. CG1]|uniref:transposase family protein n=1 Tax=Streptomyces sp. CG1 TaxID=1287523 RepID=UPI0034E2D401
MGGTARVCAPGTERPRPSAGAAGAGPNHQLVFVDPVLITLVHLRLQLPHEALAELYGVTRSTVTRKTSARRSVQAADAPNPVTGEPSGGPGYAPTTVGHSETVYAASTTATRTRGPDRYSTRFHWTCRVALAGRTRTAVRWTADAERPDR